MSGTTDGTAERGEARMAIQLLAAAAEEGSELPISPVAFGLVSLGVFAVLLAVTWAFRSVGKRH